MKDSRTYKIIGRYPDEGVNFPNNVRIQFRAYHFTTLNPTEIATIESSDAFKRSKIIRIKERTVEKTGPKTSSGVATTTPFGADKGDLAKKDAEISEKDKQIEALKKELAEREEMVVDTPEEGFDPVPTKDEELSKNPPPSGPGDPAETEEKEVDETAKKEEDKKKGSSKKK